MSKLSFAAAGLCALFLYTAVLLPQQGYAESEANAAVNKNEVPVGPVTKNRPPDPSGVKTPYSYPEGFLTLSEPSVLSEPAEKADHPQQTVLSEPVNTQPANWAFLFGTIISVALFLVVAWTDHTYRVRLQSIVAQNNRLLNGEDVDLIGDAPAVGIPLFLGTSEAVGGGLNAQVDEFLSESSESADHTDPGFNE